MKNYVKHLKGGRYMILFAILATIMALLLVIAFVTIVVGGTGFIVIFGDVIVCIVLIGLLIKFLFFRK